MSYLEFLSEWYNLAFVASAIAGLSFALWARLRVRDGFRVSATLVIASVVGLTWNGVIHDLGLGPAGPRFPYVLAGSAALGWLGGLGLARLRSRHFRPITAVRFNRPGHEGVEARVVTRTAGAEPGSGRAQWQDQDGVLHIVHIHTGGTELGFGRKVRLGGFDAAAESYLVKILPRRRRRSAAPGLEPPV